jgi:CMP-N,N'-diacetyllegionaminic acid synthase
MGTFYGGLIIKNRILAIIPARAGSKGIKKKNIKLLNGNPLISYTIAAAIESKIFDDVVVSTDSREIAKISEEYGATIPFIRPKELASDTAKSSEVIVYCLNYFKKENYRDFMLLQPTSPLRTAENIIEAYNLYRKKKADSVVSVCQTEFSPEFCFSLGNDLEISNFISKEIRRQELKKYFQLNGAIYISDVRNYLESKSFYKGKCFAYIMDKRNSIDIDDIFDFKFAEFLMLENKSL